MLFIDKNIKLNVNIELAGLSDSFRINHIHERKLVLTLIKICYNITYYNHYFLHTIVYNCIKTYLGKPASFNSTVILALPHKPVIVDIENWRL